MIDLTSNQKDEIYAKAQQTGQNILQNVIIYGLEAIKWTANFIGLMVKQVMGK